MCFNVVEYFCSTYLLCAVDSMATSSIPRVSPVEVYLTELVFSIQRSARHVGRIFLVLCFYLHCQLGFVLVLVIDKKLFCNFIASKLTSPHFTN